MTTPEPAATLTDGTGRKGGALGKKAVWIIADQALSSLSNAGLTIGLARVVSPTEYGAFALAFTIYSLVLACSQSVTNQVLVIRYSDAEPERRIRATAAGAGAALTVGGIAALLMIGASALVGVTVQQAIFAAAIVIPALLLQDFWRTVFVAFGTPARAFVNDLIWTVLWAGAFVVLFSTNISTAFWFLLAWGLSGGVAALIGSRQAHSRPRIGQSRLWLLGHRDVSGPSFANTIAAMGAIQIAFLLIGAVGAVDDVGALRATQTLLGPLNIVGFALASFAMPEIVRRGFGRKGLLLSATALSGVMVLLTLAWGGILLLLPASAGIALLGDTWAGAREALPGMVIYTCCIAATNGATAVMRSLDRVRSSLIVSALLGPLVLIASVIGVRIGGSAGAGFGFALGAAITVIPCWLLLVRDARLGRRKTVAVL